LRKQRNPGLLFKWSQALLVDHLLVRGKNDIEVLRFCRSDETPVGKGVPGHLSCGQSEVAAKK